MKILFRKKSKVILQDDTGRYWLTRRKKLRPSSTCRRQLSKYRSVRYTPIKELTETEILIYQ